MTAKAAKKAPKKTKPAKIPHTLVWLGEAPAGRLVLTLGSNRHTWNRHVASRRIPTAEWEAAKADVAKMVVIEGIDGDVMQTRLAKLLKRGVLVEG